MDLNLRNQRQKEFAQEWLNFRFGILNLCPRFGKIYTTINILEQLPSNISILISYPDREIKKSWQTDFKKRQYKNTNITYCTHRSLEKYVDKKFDLVVIDEIHLLSERQRDACAHMFLLNRDVLGLTGTLSNETEFILFNELGLKVISYYPLEQGIAEKVITDYEIRIIKVELDDKKKGMFKKPERTEKKQFKAVSWVIERKKEAGEDFMFLALSRMRIVQNSEAKRLKTLELIEQYSDERILVFCGKIEIAENLGIPAFHNKTKDKTIFTDFAEGKGKHLAVVKIGNAGITYKPLSKVIINYFDSNPENLTQRILRCMGMEYDTPDKKSIIYIISSTEEVEGKWLRKALEFFDHNKIIYLT